MAKSEKILNRVYYKEQLNKLTTDLDEQLLLTQEQKIAYVLNAQKIHAERFLKDNERIWTVSTLFIPLSLAGLGSLKDKDFSIVLLLGAASIALICFWYLASEKLRGFQEKNEKRVIVFDLYLGIDTSVIDVEKELLEPKPKPANLKFWDALNYWHERFMLMLANTTIQKARLYMFRIVITLWLVAILYSLLQLIITVLFSVIHDFVNFITYPLDH